MALALEITLLHRLKLIVLWTVICDVNLQAKQQYRNITVAVYLDAMNITNAVLLTVDCQLQALANQLDGMDADATWQAE